ncbi:MAG TPA: hypothetical protein PLV92_20035, partial [Pirellulaceae bacterium]|nr:hypothetical protein [Pirellulaceae bacterium]
MRQIAVDSNGANGRETVTVAGRTVSDWARRLADPSAETRRVAAANLAQFGVAALSGAGTAAPPGAAAPDEAAASMGTLFVGTAILAMAAFAPFLVLKLIPWAEAALVAQGVSRSPIRGAQATMSN